MEKARDGLNEIGYFVVFFFKFFFFKIYTKMFWKHVTFGVFM